MSSRDIASDPAYRMRRHTSVLLWLLCPIFVALMAGISANMELPQPGIVMALIGYVILLFLSIQYKNSRIGVALACALAGFIGYTLGPVIGESLVNHSFLLNQ